MKQTELLSDSTNGITRAAALLKDGRIIALPTETVYGLAGDARDSAAVAAIYTAKGRPSFNPLIVHLADAAQAAAFVHWNNDAEKLASALWPGPLTMVLPLRAGHGLSPLVTAGLESVALRVPAHPLAHAVLSAFGGPVAAPSANPSGRISPTTAAHVKAGLDGQIDAIIDGGDCGVGVESTIIGLLDRPTLLRPGGVACEDIEAVLGAPLALHDGAAINAPGQLGSHYAPGARVRLNAKMAEGGEVLLGFGPIECDLNLSRSGDLTEAATNLFAHLHRLDQPGVTGIAVAPIPDTGLGLAINDRLRRAAAPRD